MPLLPGEVVLNLDHVTPSPAADPPHPRTWSPVVSPATRRKGNRTAEKFGHPRVQARVDRPLADAACMNATRYEIANRLRGSGLAVTVSNGGVTRAVRDRFGLPKATGEGPPTLHPRPLRLCQQPLPAPRPAPRSRPQTPPAGLLRVRHRRHPQSRRAHRRPQRRPHPPSRYPHHRGSFLLITATGSIDGIFHRHCKLLQHGTGWTRTTHHVKALDVA